MKDIEARTLKYMTLVNGGRGITIQLIPTRGSFYFRRYNLPHRARIVICFDGQEKSLATARRGSESNLITLFTSSLSTALGEFYLKMASNTPIKPTITDPTAAQNVQVRLQ